MAGAAIEVIMNIRSSVTCSSSKRYMLVVVGAVAVVDSVVEWQLGGLALVAVVQ